MAAGAAGCASSEALVKATAARCPANDRHPAYSNAPATRTTLVPTGAIRLTLCRYRGLSPDRKRVSTLARVKAVTSRARLAHLTREFDALPPFPSTGAIDCPLDDDSETIAIFSYRQAPADPVLVSLTGCPAAYNGHLLRWAGEITAEMK